VNPLIDKSKVTLTRQPNRFYAVRLDGAKVGEAWKWPSKAGFGLRLTGISWRADKPNRTGGITTTSISLLRDVPAKVSETLNTLGDTP
jgi:hypothetical protein